MRSQTRIDAVMDEIKLKISSRTYLPSHRLPSVRQQARTLQVSVSTVVEAYERLMAEGIILSKPGSGFYVPGPVAPLALAQIGPKLDREVDPLWVSRQALDTDHSTLKPGCGWLPPEWLYETGIRRALRSMAKAKSLELVEYATPAGHPELRQLISRRLTHIGVEASPEHIMLTESGTQAIDLICRFLLEAGDTVIIDDPCYFNFHALLKAHRINIVSVPYTPHGPDLEIFQSVLAEHSPRLYITNSGIHNPTLAQCFLPSRRIAYLNWWIKPIWSLWKMIFLPTLNIPLPHDWLLLMDSIVSFKLVVFQKRFQPLCAAAISWPKMSGLKI